jgi:hypothetical protein
LNCDEQNARHSSVPLAGVALKAGPAAIEMFGTSIANVDLMKAIESGVNIS